MNKSTFTGLLLALFVSIQLQAQLPTPYLVKDINQRNNSSHPEFKIEYNGLLYFVANDGINGKELWVTNGNSMGTNLISNTNADYFNDFHQSNGLLFFTTSKGYLKELWRTDGSQAGTIRLDSAIASYEISSLNNQLYFQKGGSLWGSDGTIAGTQSLKTINNNSNPNIRKYIQFNNQLFFYADDGINGDELWTTDGTANGTSLFKDIQTGLGSSYAEGERNFSIYNNHLYFTADDGIHGPELWVTDGTTAGTQLFKDLLPGINGANPQELAVCNNRLLFFNRGEYNVIDAQIWSTDGDSNNVQSIHLIHSDSWNEAIQLTSIGHSAFFFSGNDSISVTDFGIWTTDGTSNNTHLINNVLLNFELYNPHPAPELTILNDKVYYMLSNNGLWQADTSALVFVDSFYKNTLFTNFINLYTYQNEIYFGWNNSDSINGLEPHKIDPITGNWNLLQNINNQNSASNFSPMMTSLNGKLYFGVNQFLWESEGQANNTNTIYESTTYLPWSTAPCSPYILNAANNNIIFSCGGYIHGFDLGSLQKRSLGYFSYEHKMYEYDGYHYFGGAYGLERTNGVSSNQVFNPSNTQMFGFNRISEITNSNQQLFFYMQYLTENNGNFSDKKGIWVSDGLNQNEKLIEFCSDCEWNDTIPSGSYNFTEFQRNTFFSLQGTDYGTELWVTNGDVSGTLLHTDFGSGHLSNFFNYQNRLYFKKDHQIWRLDHPVHQPYAFVDLDTLVECNNARNFKIFNDQLYFIATNDNGDDILWMMNGSRMSIRPLLTPDGNPIRTNAISIIDNYILFSNGDATHGRELWISGGYTHNTYRLSDINPGTASSSPAQFTKAGNLIYFVAEDGVHGRELWAIDALPLSQEIIPELVEQDFRIYPNPSKGQFTLELNQQPENPISAHLYNLQGQLLQSYQLSDKTNTLESKALPAGLYLLQLEDGRAVKIVIER